MIPASSKSQTKTEFYKRTKPMIAEVGQKQPHTSRYIAFWGFAPPNSVVERLGLGVHQGASCAAQAPTDAKYLVSTSRESRGFATSYSLAGSHGFCGHDRPCLFFVFSFIGEIHG